MVQASGLPVANVLSEFLPPKFPWLVDPQNACQLSDKCLKVLPYPILWAFFGGAGDRTGGTASKTTKPTHLLRNKGPRHAVRF